jgi:acyl-CoA reductase-like NAD-dependent aldehyde dehydrogenase
VGDGFTSGVAVGPVISEAALDRIDSWVREAAEAGARVLVGGKRLRAGDGVDGDGFFYAPTVVEDIPAGCALAREEVFGPVVRGAQRAPEVRRRL